MSGTHLGSCWLQHNGIFEAGSLGPPVIWAIKCSCIPVAISIALKLHFGWEACSLRWKVLSSDEATSLVGFEVHIFLLEIEIIEIILSVLTYRNCSSPIKRQRESVAMKCKVLIINWSQVR